MTRSEIGKEYLSGWEAASEKYLAAKRNSRFIQLWSVLWPTILMIATASPDLSAQWDTSAGSSFGNGQTLFRIERSRDSHFLVYELERELLPSTSSDIPIGIYWVDPGHPDRRDPLTRIQSRYGYGIELMEHLSGTEEEWKFRMVSFPEKTLVLKRKGTEGYGVFSQMNDREVMIEKLYVKFSNDSFWHPKVSHITIYGRDTETGSDLRETIGMNMSSQKMVKR